MAQAVLQSTGNAVAHRGGGHRIPILGGGGGVKVVSVRGGVPLLLLPGLKSGGQSEKKLRVGRRTNVLQLQQQRAGCVGSQGAVGVRCSLNEAPSTSGPTVYQGVYGPWSVEAEDVREV